MISYDIIKARHNKKQLSLNKFFELKCFKCGEDIKFSSETRVRKFKILCVGCYYYALKNNKKIIKDGKRI